VLNIKEKDRTTILNALKAGVVPPVGLKHIQVGRAQEVTEIVKDIDHIANGGSTVRFIVGDFGAGKSFFLTLCKLIAHEKKMVVVNADITTERILCSSDGKARSLITELFKNMSCRSRPDGNAFRYVIETWIGLLVELHPEPTARDFRKALEPLSNFALSSDFAEVLYQYFVAYHSNDQAKIDRCMKWVRAEYETKTEAKADLGVNRIVEDADLYDMLKLTAGFCRLAGFTGLLVNVDELAVMIRLRAPQRHKNYETLLSLINDSLQGTTPGIGFVFGATSEAIENKEKGLFSYGALETRLASNRFATKELRDLSGPIIVLQTLIAEELLVLLHKLRDIHRSGLEREVLDDHGVQAFFQNSMRGMGAIAHISPRDITKDFLGLLSLLESNPSKTWKDLISLSTTAGQSQSSALVTLKAN
jgi:hypothetical protein